MLNADPALWHYGEEFNAQRVEAEHNQFVDLLQKLQIEILWMDGDDREIADSVFTYDASLVTPAGAILMNPGKPLRKGEQELHRAFYAQHGIPVVGEVTGEGSAEAGDTLWLDDHTLLIGRGFRTNQRGVDQIREMVSALGVNVIVFDLPVYKGESACLHLMSLISLVDRKTALVCASLLPTALYQYLKSNDFELLEAPFSEFENSGTLSNNVLAASPGHCIMVAGMHQTKALLESAGIKVAEFNGDALCIGCEGGPTCLTRPVLRHE